MGGWRRGPLYCAVSDRVGWGHQAIWGWDMPLNLSFQVVELPCRCTRRQNWLFMCFLDCPLHQANFATGKTGYHTLYNYHLQFSDGVFIYMSMSRSIYRRGARRWRKMYKVNGHIFQVIWQTMVMVMQKMTELSFPSRNRIVMSVPWTVWLLHKPLRVLYRQFVQRPRQQNSFTKMARPYFFGRICNLVKGKQMCHSLTPTHFENV